MYDSHRRPCPQKGGYHGKEGQRTVQAAGHIPERILEASLNDGLALTRAAARMGVAVSTVRRELLRNRRHDGMSKSANRDKNDCAFLKPCKVKNRCDRKGCRRLCRACPAPCERFCGEYVPKLCETTAKAPFVCNACVRYSMCTLDRWKYSAESAQNE